MTDEAGYLDGRIDAVREHLLALVAAAPGLPAELERVRGLLAQEWQARGPGTVLALIAGFIVLGFALEGLYRYFVPRAEVRDAGPRERALSIARRVGADLGALAAFALGSAAVFLAFEWPARIRQVVMGVLVAFILLRLTIVLSRALFSPRDARLRVLPASDGEALFRHRRIVLFAGWLAFGWVLVRWLVGLGMNLPSAQLIAYALGLGLLAIAIEACWRRSRVAALYFVAVWLLWAAKATGAFWVAVIAGVLPVVMRQAQAGADHVLGPGVPAAAVGRALRALAIIGAAWILLHAFGLDVDSIAAADSVWARVLRGAVHALAIVLIAEVVWKVCAALIDQKLATQGEANARLRTLLPIVRGTLAVVLLVMTVLMALSALGVQVAPLLASAGVVGIAVGFGAQQLVRDLFAKFSYLFDDAFRVGEYIESGAYKGTVEHLGTRTVRLRHHRGPIFTIPYGLLGAVKNSSRDWVIDKITIGVAYDTDLDKAKKLIKKIGQQLAEEPDFKPHILEPLKMQGVEQFSDYAIQIRIKMKTRPNQQFTIRRHAYAMIKKVFAENGIRFAHPTVQVAGGAGAADAAVAAARQVIDRKPAGAA